MEKRDNVIKVKPRREQIVYKGLHGWVEYVPSQKTWLWSFKAQLTIKNEGVQASKDAAILELKRFMDTASVSKNVRSVD